MATKKSEIVQVRLTPNERTGISAVAEAEELTVSEYIRKVLKAELIKNKK